MANWKNQRKSDEVREYIGKIRKGEGHKKSGKVRVIVKKVREFHSRSLKGAIYGSE